MTTTHAPLTGPPTLLAAIHEFHRLRAKHGTAQGLAPDEEVLFALLVDIFEPLRMTSHGPRRTPIMASVNRRALLLTADGAQRAKVLRIALRRLWLETRSPLPLGAEAIAAIASATERRVYAFRGRVTRTYPTVRVASLELVAAEPTFTCAIDATRG